MAKDFFCKLKFIFIPCKNNKWRPRFLNSKFLFYYAVVLLFLKLIIVPFLFYFPETAFFADLTKISLVQLTNTAREQFGYPLLKENEALNYAARLKAQDMVARGYFAHYSPEGISPWYWLERSGYTYRAAGENLAIGFLESEQVHFAWMNSLSHRNNILNPNYQEIGIAVVKGNFQGNETTLVVQFLGTQTIKAPQKKPVEVLIPQIKEEEEENKGQVIGEEIKEQDPLTSPEQEQDPLTSPGQEQDPSISLEQEQDPSPIIVQEQEIKEIRKTPVFFLFQFMTGDYYKWIQRAIYFSLFLIILLLLVTFYCDIFVYRKFKIDYRDVVFKTIGFSALWFVLIFLDKLIIVQIIAQNFRIN